MGCSNAFVHNPGCDGCNDDQVVDVLLLGCYGLPIEAGTYGIWTDSGKSTLVASGTTDVSGQCRLSVPAGMYYIEAAAPRFLTQPDTIGVLPGRNSFSITMPIDSSQYACFWGPTERFPHNLAYPVNKTLHATNGSGPWVLLWQPGGVWVSATAHIAYDGCGEPPDSCRADIAPSYMTTFDPWPIVYSGTTYFGPKYICPSNQPTFDRLLTYDKSTSVAPFIPGKSAFVLIATKSNTVFIDSRGAWDDTCVLNGDVLVMTE